MNKDSLCRCCLSRPPEKDLKTFYVRLGKTEIYADMLKECFEIHLPPDDNGFNAGICDVCVCRLRDASDFKEQVLRCQKEFQLRLLTGFDLKDEDSPKVKLEPSDAEDENGIYFLEFKDELLDDELKEKDDTSLAAILGFDDVSVKRKAVEKSRKKNGRKMLVDGKNDRKSGIKISFRKIAQIDKLNQTTKPSGTQIRFVSENKKHKINIDNIVKYSNCTPFSNKTIAGIVCAYCKETYQDPQELRTHNQEMHKNDELNDKRIDKNNISIKMDITDLKCNLCNLNIDCISNLKKHLISEHNIKFFPDVNDYILEFKLSSSEILNCALCNSTFETFKMLLQHMNGHYRNYICDVCDMGFINQHRLKNHKRTHDVGTFKCEFCDKIFSTRVRKMCHEKYTHNTSARYTTNCPQCDQSFTSYYQRNRHMFQEHNTVAASYKCNICDKSFILKSKLTSHIKKVHLMERNHTCTECGQGFFIKQSLDEHMIKHNGERVFKCTVCHKAYARKKTLREHMRIHNNDRRFKCGICGLAFVQKCSLKSHMLSNHGVSLSEFESSQSELCSP